MYQVNVKQKTLTKIPITSFGELGVKERDDIQEWVDANPELLGEPLKIISKELTLPSGKRLDLLAIDENGNLVIIELKRDDSGQSVEWQAIKYASYCSAFTNQEIFTYLSSYQNLDEGEAEKEILDFVNCEAEELNQFQRIIIVSKEFHSEVISAVLWLRESSIDITCVRLTPFRDESNNVFINPEIIIPLPEAKDYIEKKETKQKKQFNNASSFSLERSNLPVDQLKEEIRLSLNRPGELTPRLKSFIKILLEEPSPIDRDRLKKILYENYGIGKNIGQTGRYLSGISQFLTKKSNPHLRQVVEFETGGGLGEMKNNYKLVDQYRNLVQEVVNSLEEV